MNNRDDLVGIGCVGAILFGISAAVGWFGQPDASEYCRNNRPGFWDRVYGSHTMPVCADLLRQTERTIRRLETEMITLQATLSNVETGQNTLRQTFNRNVDIDNRRNRAINHTIDAVRTRSGHCGYHPETRGDGTVAMVPNDCSTVER